MDIWRINNYTDERFSKRVLFQHGCFLIEEKPYEIEIVSDKAAIVRGEKSEYFEELIEYFRFYTPHIYLFYDEDEQLIKEYDKPNVFEIALKDVQPSQFYVDEDKIAAIKTFINNSEDIIIQCIKYDNRFISLDGHTRLYYAHLRGFERVRAVLSEIDDCIYDFVEEAISRGILEPKDLVLLSHMDYEKKWNLYCDNYFENRLIEEQTE